MILLINGFDNGKFIKLIYSKAFMIEWIIAIIIAIIVGYFIGKYFTEKTKFGDKEAILKAEWGKKIANLEKDYEIKLEKGKSFVEKIKEENKTHLEKLAKEWQVKYVQDIEELKRLFKESEKIIRAKSVSSSRRSLVGKFIERFIPFLKKIPYEPSDMHFLGQPVDYIVFQGLHEDKIDKVIFVEVKTGKSKLTKREKSLKETIEKKRVGWKEINVDTSEENTPDEEIGNKETSINELYETINQKISSAKNKIPKIEEDETEEIGNEEDESDKEEYENLTNEDIEKYKEKIMSHSDFPDGEITSQQVLKFIKKNFPEICEEVDDEGLKIISNEIENDISE